MPETGVSGTGRARTGGGHPRLMMTDARTREEKKTANTGEIGPPALNVAATNTGTGDEKRYRA